MTLIYFACLLGVPEAVTIPALEMYVCQRDSSDADVRT